MVVLSEVEALAWIPILHIEAHGSEEGLQLANGQVARWDDTASAVQSINIATRNNLLLVLSACYGINVLRTFATTLLSPAPFRLVIGPEAVEAAGGLEDGFLAFYRGLLLNECAGENAIAQLKSSVPSIAMYSAEQLFASGMNKYFEEHGSRKVIDERVDAALRELVAANSVADIGALRRQAKERIRNPGDGFERRKQRFFMIDRYPELEPVFAHIRIEGDDP